MKDFFSDLWSAAAALFGAAVFFGIMYSAVYLHSAWWRQVSAHYAGKCRRGMIERIIPETIVVTSRGGARLEWPLRYWRVYAASTITLHEDGLAITQIPPFNIMCPPLFLPFDEMELKQTDWMLWPDPYVLRMSRTPHIDIIVALRVVAWVREHCDKPPFGFAPPD